MRLPLLVTLIFLACNLGLDYYLFKRLRQCGRITGSWIFAGFTVLLTIMLIVCIIIVKQRPSEATLHVMMWLLYAYFTVYFPKWVFAIFDWISAVPKLFHHHRWHIISIAGGIIAIAIFAVMWEGALVTAKTLQIKKVTVAIENLPPDFNNFTIAQISDMHLGTYNGKTEFVEKIVKEVNALHADMICFTGDLVNARAVEAEPYLRILSRLRAPYGVYSVLGNHDYGDYAYWPNEKAKAENLEHLEQIERQAGWRLLNNETYVIHKGEDSLAIVGVENIGDPPFKSYGSLRGAYSTTEDDVTKVLLTHNPAHWTDSISSNPHHNIALTLSGHTHAGQIEVAHFTPISFRYPTWGGLYTDKDKKHQLYVNIGTGMVAFPARIGKAIPEITLITLKDSSPL